MQGCYHSCHKKKTETEHIKRLTTKRRKRGKQCFFPTNNRCLRPTKMKYFEHRPYHTRQRARLHREVCSDLEYKVKKAISDTLKRVHQDNLHMITDFKILSIKDV